MRKLMLGLFGVLVAGSVLANTNDFTTALASAASFAVTNGWTAAEGGLVILGFLLVIWLCMRAFKMVGRGR